MITNKMVYEHQKKYKTFKAEDLIKWLDEQNNRHYFKTVAKANSLFRRHKNFEKYCSKW